MAAAEIAPNAAPRRSPVYRRLLAAGARFVAIGDAAIAEGFGEEAGEAERVARAGLADLTPLPRWGLKGRGTHDWLGARGIAVPAANNRAAPLEGGGLVARLSDGEALLMAGLAGDDGVIGTARAAWQDERRAGGRPGGYPVPRGASHAWFCLTGEDAPAALAKLCAVDLRARSFAGGAVAQTVVAEIAAIVIRDGGGHLTYHLLADMASADYLWAAVMDGIAEFGGGPVGWRALRRARGLEG